MLGLLRWFWFGGGGRPAVAPGAAVCLRGADTTRAALTGADRSRADPTGADTTLAALTAAPLEC
jgi:uncharacterized protein YjbI with pentapeptide repeats